jgi:hypothetical protein
MAGYLSSCHIQLYNWYPLTISLASQHATSQPTTRHVTIHYKPYQHPPRHVNIHQSMYLCIRRFSVTNSMLYLQVACHKILAVEIHVRSII